MKKILLVAIFMAIVFSGCSINKVDPKKLEKAYEVGKVAYKVGKVVVKATGVNVPSDLVTADKILVGVDKARIELKKSVIPPIRTDTYISTVDGN